MTYNLIFSFIFIILFSSCGENSTQTPILNSYNDKYYATQWYLDKINIQNSWSITKGKGVKIAALDDSFDIYHEDFEDLSISSYDISSNSSDVSGYFSDDYHGTAVSGIISAQHNSKGIAGIAPESELLVIQHNKNEYQILKALEYAKEQDVDIINCSWAYYNLTDAIKDKLYDLTTNGRDGKGIVVVFSAGNDSSEIYNSSITSVDNLIVVGASTYEDDLAWYSNFGKFIDIVAPGGDGIINISTLDVMGDDGLANDEEKDPNYLVDENDNATFYGTSAAAPIVTASIALLLSINPDLTRDEVEGILKNSATKIGEHEYIDGRNDFYGFGKLDITKAISSL